MFSVQYEPLCGKYLEHKKVGIDGEKFLAVVFSIYRVLHDDKNVN